MPGDEATASVVRVAAAWDSPAVRDFCAGLEAAARRVPDEAVIHRGRNLIFRAAVGATAVAVKRFPVSGARTLVYRLRASKGARAFDNAARLVALGIRTPSPVAAVELRRGGTLLASFYCCALVPRFREARDLKRRDAADRDALLELLGGFVGELHERGALHRDLTSGNVLMVPDPGSRGGVSFELVDVNRMRFGRVATRRGLANLALLRLHDDGRLLSGYCRARGLDREGCERPYRLRVRLRSLARALKDGTRPLRRRVGL